MPGTEVPVLRCSWGRPGIPGEWIPTRPLRMSLGQLDLAIRIVRGSPPLSRAKRDLPDGSADGGFCRFTCKSIRKRKASFLKFR